MTTALPDISDWYARDGRAAQAEADWILEGRYKQDADFAVAHMKAAHLKNVLELGCGSGLFAAQIRRLLPAVDYRGIDTCQLFIDMARKRAPELYFHNEDLRTCTAYDVDLVCCWTTLKHFGLHEWDTVLQHMLSLAPYAAFSVQTLPRLDLDDGREYHHVFVTRSHLESAVSAGGHEIVEAFVTGSADYPGEGLQENLSLWTRRKG